MSRPRQPTQLKVLQGSRIRDDRDALKQQAQPEIGLPNCPEWLDLKMRRKWHKIGPELVNLGLLTVIDGDIFGSYVETATRYGEVCEKLDSIVSIHAPVWGATWRHDIDGCRAR